MAKQKFIPPTSIDQGNIVDFNGPNLNPDNIKLLKHTAQKAINKLYFLETAIHAGKDNSEMHDPDCLEAMGDFLYDIEKDVQFIFDQMGKEEVPNDS